MKKMIFFIFSLFIFLSCETLDNLFKPSQSTSSGSNNSKNETTIKSNQQTTSTGNSNQQKQTGTPLSTTQSSANVNRRGDPDSKNWDIVSLDTAANVDYLSNNEKDVILEMNKARADPKKYAELYIQPMLQYNWGGPFGPNSYLAPGKAVYTSTQEGKNGIQLCINDLAKRQNMPPLNPEKGLFLAARDHVNDTGPKGITGHTGNDKSTMAQRINRYGKWSGGSGENISYGYSIGRDIVVQLLIDDGVPNRGHRNNILNKNFKVAGNSIGNHTKFTYMCVINYANDYTSN